jgi:hypothetical protein
MLALFLTIKKTAHQITLTEDATVITDNMLDDAINPSHYKSHPSGVQCIDISKHLSGCLAQAFQYVWQCGQKDNPIQDLDKAIWFIRAEMSIDEWVHGAVWCTQKNLAYVLAHEVDNNRFTALASIVTGNSSSDFRTTRLLGAIRAIEELKAVYLRCGV